MLINYKTQLSQKKQLTEDVYLYTFKLIDPPEISFSAGQYVILFVPQEGNEPVRRLFSIASPNTMKNELEFLVKIIPGGCASNFFLKLPIGSEATFQGPAGAFLYRESSREKIALVTGTGYAPVRSMLLSNPGIRQNYTLFFGIPTYKDVFLFDELVERAKKNKSFTFYVCLSREQNLDMVPEENRKYFLLGRVTSGFEQKIFNATYTIANTDFYLCGGREVVESLKQYVYGKGAVKEQVYFEKF